MSNRPKIIRTSLALVAATALAALIAACGSTASGHAAKRAPARHVSGRVLSGNVHVIIKDYAYHPDNFTVRAGTRITFTNEDQTAHTATANSGAWNTGTIDPGHSATVKLVKPGVYPYHCIFHPFMTGTVTVVR